MCGKALCQLHNSPPWVQGTGTHAFPVPAAPWTGRVPASSKTSFQGRLSPQHPENVLFLNTESRCWLLAGSMGRENGYMHPGWTGQVRSWVLPQGLAQRGLRPQ